MNRAVAAFVAIAAWLASGALAQTPVERTATLGVEFRQDGQIVPLTPGERVGGQQIFTLTLRPEPFEISLPNSAWAPEDRDRYVALGISTDPNFLSQLRIGQRVYETPFLGPYRAMAYDRAELGGLLTAERPLPNGRPDGAFNSLGAHRYGPPSSDRQILRVTTIDDRANFQPRLAEGVTATMVFYLDRDTPPGRPPSPAVDNDIVRSEEVDIVRVTFE